MDHVVPGKIQSDHVKQLALLELILEKIGG